MKGNKKAMSSMQEETQQLFAWEEQAKKIVAESTLRAQAIGEEAARTHIEQLTRFKEEAKDAASQARARLPEQIDPQCQAKRAEAEKEASHIRQEGLQNIQAAVHAALQQLFMEEERHARGR